jgi:hypothetical protein
MPAIMADHDIEGQMQVLLRLLISAAWHTLWTELAVRVESFTSLGVPANTPDASLWQLCQTRQIILITGNRNEEGPASLEATLQESNTPTSLPVLTISEPQRILSSRAYAHLVVERLVEYLIDVENLRGTGRLYLP